MSQEDWPSWVKEKCTANNWQHPPCSSPLIWRELIDRGGKGVYLGGVTEFQKYTTHYYNIAPCTNEETEISIAAENLDMFKTIQLEVAQSKPSDPIIVCITHASCSTAYHLASLLLTQNVFKDNKLHLMLFDDSSHYELVNALALELQDMATPNLQEITIATSPHEAFTAVSALFILDYNDISEQSVTLPSSQEAAKIYTYYAGVIDYSANKNIRVVLVGPYANIGAGIMAHTVNSIDKKQFIASPAVAEYQACSILARKLNISSSDVSQVSIWGTCNSHSMIPDTSHTLVYHYKGSIVGNDSFSLPLDKCLFDKKWLKEDFPNLLTTRYVESKSSLVEAVTLTRLMKNWWNSESKAWHSVGVVLKDKEPPLCQPCRCINGIWEKVEGEETNNNEFKEKIDKIKDKLQEELKSVIVLSSQERKNEEDNMAQ